MSYEDRLRDLRYVSPSGATFTADFEELARSGGKKNAVHELPQQDLAIVQDLGQSAKRFALKLYFQGADYDKTADAFFDALGEHGPATLRHPRWGDLSVLALTYAQSEHFVDGMGEASFDIDFVHAPGAQAPGANDQTPAAIKSGASTTASAVSNSSVGGFGSPELADLVACKDRVKKSIKAVKSETTRISGLSSVIAQRVNAEIASLTNDIDTIIATPATMFDNIVSIIMAPAGVVAYVVDKLQAFGNLLDAMPHDAPITPAQGALASHIAVTTACASASAITSGDLLSRAEALAAHDDLVAIFKAAVQLVESYEAASGYIASPEDMALLAALQAQAAQYLLSQSYSLRVERRVTLDGAASPLELIYRFYGEATDLRLDEFCEENHLQGDALSIVPAGTEVLYYAE